MQLSAVYIILGLAAFASAAPASPTELEDLSSATVCPSGSKEYWCMFDFGKSCIFGYVKNDPQFAGQTSGYAIHYCCSGRGEGGDGCTPRSSFDSVKNCKKI